MLTLQIPEEIRISRVPERQETLGSEHWANSKITLSSQQNRVGFPKIQILEHFSVPGKLSPQGMPTPIDSFTFSHSENWGSQGKWPRFQIIVSLTCSLRLDKKKKKFPSLPC